FITALAGIGTYAALAAAAVHTLAHALYKAALFMVVGVIDKEAGSRDIRKLSGLRHVMPISAAVTAMAALSMAGFPPFLGFVSKEEAFGAFFFSPASPGLDVLAALGAVVATIMTFAYGARIFYGAFGGSLTQALYEPPKSFVAPAALTALAGLFLGPAVSLLDPLVNRIAFDALGLEPGAHLALWHGFTPALALSVVTIGVGGALFLMRDRVDRFMQSLRGPLTGDGAFDHAHRSLISLGSYAGRPFVSIVPARHVAWALVSVAVAGVAAFVLFGAPAGPPAASRPGDWIIAVFLAITCLGVARSTDRFAAVALLAIAGFLVGVLYVLLGAPDLVLTQLLVETLTVVLLVLVLRHLPRPFAAVSRQRKWVAASVAAVTGLVAGAATYVHTGRRGLSAPGEYYLESARSEAGGDNVVNTILVDFRALDTLGEITVLATAIIGIVALVRLSQKSTR
ncbi:MAG: DUF4040 domain-containing protein, partial [Actinomycetota bacterium]|nr:DUF4040 domain-containing protein [Actinomycetota bacterium]